MICGRGVPVLADMGRYGPTCAISSCTRCAAPGNDTRHSAEASASVMHTFGILGLENDMTPRELMATAIVPGGGEELRLYRRGADFMILLDRAELMSTRMSGSEEALAEMTCARLHDRPRPHLLIGGYGMGFTLRAALAVLDHTARITVVELVPEIIAWARGPMASLMAGCLDDPRVRLVEGDVASVIAETASAYDAILLDVDNGPDGLTRTDNNRLYSTRGLAAAKRALTPDGILSIWSAAPDPVFSRRLASAGFRTDEVVVRARSNGKGPRHVIWFATPAGPGMPQ